jgi:hypothetical protein
MPSRSARAALALVLFAACKRDSSSEGGGDRKSPPARFPAPNSPLARELGTDDAGRGEYRYFDDGPWCGFAVHVDRKKPLGSTATMKSNALMAPLQYGPVAFFETERAPQEGPRDEARKVMLKLTLRGPARVMAEDPIRIELTLGNDSPVPLVFTMAVDGSFEHWKSPFTDLYARDESSGKTYRWAHGASYGRCGNVNSRSKDDIVRLPPGQKKKAPFGPWSETALGSTIDRPGRYTLWVVYSACSGPELGGRLGDDDPLPADLFDGTIVSNGIPVEVTARGGQRPSDAADVDGAGRDR